MFLGASLDPEYFTKRINLFVALAPVSTTSHIGENEIFFDSSINLSKLIELVIVDGLGYYNWFAPMPLADGAIDAVCGLLPDICKYVIKHIHNKDGVDNPNRFDVFMSSEPSG